MIVTCVHVTVKKDHIDDFIKASRENHLGSTAEPGNLRFDILQSRDEPSRFLLYEAYESAAAAAAHKTTPHYLRWRETVEPWMDGPRQGVPYDVVCPLDPRSW